MSRLFIVLKVSVVFWWNGESRLFFLSLNVAFCRSCIFFTCQKSRKKLTRNFILVKVTVELCKQTWSRVSLPTTRGFRGSLPATFQRELTKRWSYREKRAKKLAAAEEKKKRGDVGKRRAKNPWLLHDKGSFVHGALFTRRGSSEGILAHRTQPATTPAQHANALSWCEASS